MAKIYIPAQQMVNGLALTDPAGFPQMAQADEDNNINVMIPLPAGWDGDAMTLRLFGNVSTQPSEGAKCTVRSGTGTASDNIAYGNPSDCAVSLDIEQGFAIVGSATVVPGGDHELLRINIEYFSETYGGKLQLIGAELSYSTL